MPSAEATTAEEFTNDLSQLELVTDGSTDCNRRVLNTIQQAVDNADQDGVITVFVASGDSVLTADNSSLVNYIIDTAAVQKRLTVSLILQY